MLIDAQAQIRKYETLIYSCGSITDLEISRFRTRVVPEDAELERRIWAYCDANDAHDLLENEWRIVTLFDHGERRERFVTLVLSDQAGEVETAEVEAKS